ncbi:3-deoxy-D-manno-octulosonate 8-phosphate phosphatase [Proteus mirabilis]|uniref:3-deoxy-D-manno-octulosonate 8-phosphate phosphatase n=1 Tax=Proteus mirabilis TaxID=584 RepID=A0A379FJU6_PROMI|nr:3-deoxy-D-manno-octulosonate 8-phosphate phosphatase [Proteus mirabilis]
MNTMIETCYGAVSKQIMQKAEKVQLLICDVDGVMSDGLIYMGQ